MKFFKIPFQSGGDESLDPRLNKLQKYIQSQSVPDMTRLATEISPEVKQIIGTNVQALLGYLPNQDFKTTITANKDSLQNLLASAMITGYFMHAMELRMAMEQTMQADPESEDSATESPLEKDLLQSPESLFEGLEHNSNDQENRVPSAPQSDEKEQSPSTTNPPDKLNIQLEINTRMNRNELTELLRELHQFQEIVEDHNEVKTDSNPPDRNDFDQATDSESSED